MINHLGFGVSDLAASKAFFAASLAPLGYSIVADGSEGVGIGPGRPVIWLAPATDKTEHLHFAFDTDDRAVVDGFYRAALAAGGKDNGAPGVRPQYHPNYYAAFVIAPEGHNVEVVCHKAV
jgi:catechol 2,3-dioxygenase-like lactoylglutathione lyase family enzyme